VHPVKPCCNEKDGAKHVIMKRKGHAVAVFIALTE
jgi:hypothetical protein